MHEKELLKWFSKNQRDLPWRVSRAKLRRDPYKTWVSEVMLQQTQVKTVIGYFENWVKKFPSVKALAQSPLEEVLMAWAGLGYYSRARSLHKGANYILQNHGGELPDDVSELIKIPGVGPYTSGAISSLAYNQQAPILDGNLIRIFSRYMGWGFLPEDKNQRQTYWNLAKTWVESKQPGDVNEALMELGALVCTVKNPQCGICPLAAKCYAHQKKKTTELPPLKKRRAGVNINGYAWIIISPLGVLLTHRKKGELLGGQWTFPWSKQKNLAEVFFGNPLLLSKKELASIQVSPRLIGHAITHHKIRLYPIFLKSSKAIKKLPEGYDWHPARDLEKTLISSLSKKIWESRNLF